MKRKVATIMLFVLAALVFYGGAGVNIVSYCCNHCQMEGVEAVIESRCCEIHDHNHEMQVADGCCDTNADDPGCGIKRLYFDWTCVQSFLSGLQPVVIDLQSVRLLNVSLLPVPQVKELFSDLSAGPLVCCPRVYLSLLTTLLI